MSMAIRINSGKDKPFAVEIEDFPTEVLLEKANSALEILPFGLFLMVFLYFAVNAIAPTIALAVLAIAGVSMLIMSFLLIRRSERKNIMRFNRTGVSITEVGFFKDHRWQAHYSDYEGVYMRRREAKSGRSKSVYQIIELKHSDSQKTLPLFVDKTTVEPKERWRSYAALFDLPAKTEDS